VAGSLATSRILDTAAWGAHGAHRSFRLVLDGGVGVLAEPEDVIADGAVMVRREAAAWLVARELGWHEMVAATVLRTILFPDTGPRFRPASRSFGPTFFLTRTLDCFPTKTFGGLRSSTRSSGTIRVDSPQPETWEAGWNFLA
jgi:hypothetical protein